jgi:nucleoside transport protein
MSIILGILAIALLIGISYLFSNDKKNINFKAVAIMIGIQLVLTFLLLGTTGGLKVVDAIAGAFNKLLSYSQEGINFVIGGWIPEGGSPFFVNVLMPVIFTSALLSVLTHYKILPYIIKYIG